MPNKTLKLNKGFTLLEVIIAIFIISVGVGGVAKIMPSLIAGTSVSQSRLVVAYLAQEGVEIVRNIRDTNWLEDHNRGDSTPWDEGFFSPVNCANGCEIDYTGLTLEDPLFAVYSGRKLKIDPNGFYKYNCPGCPDAKFDRKITITPDGSDILIIKIDISWQDRGKFYNFPVQEKLYKWY